MNSRRRIWLVLNGIGLVLLGCFAGLLYSDAVRREAGVATWFDVAGSEAQWHLAHMEGLVNGMLLLVVIAPLGLLNMSARIDRTTFWGLLATGWGNTAAAVIAAASGDRLIGIGVGDNNPPALVLFGIAAAGVITALTGIVISAVSTLRAGSFIAGG